MSRIKKPFLVRAMLEPLMKNGSLKADIVSCPSVDIEILRNWPMVHIIWGGNCSATVAWFA